jgi:hypothetical protein
LLSIRDAAKIQGPKSNEKKQEKKSGAFFMLGTVAIISK